jgi:membrane-bound serine protease (ClpP class)
MKALTRILPLALLPFLLAAAPAATAKTVHVIVIKGVIDNAVAEYVRTSLAAAKAAGSEALIVKLDTPGGMLSSTKEIVQAFLDSDLPVVVYVAPAGASATSAGMMITLAGHLAVMAPGTNIGAAHPVMIGPGGDYQSIPKEDIMMEKATQDTVGWVRSICDVRGRNADWAEKAVTESQSITAKEAVAKKVVNGIAKDMDELLNVFLPRRTITLKSGETRPLDTAGAEIVELSMSTAQRVQHLLNNPNVIYILLLVGFLGIVIEFKSPGLIFPGFIGGACLLVALIAPSLPINYAGLLLIVIAFILLVAEIFIVSHGLLTVTAIAALVLGSLMLFQAPEAPGMAPFLVPALAPSWPLIATVVLLVVGTILIFGGAVLKAHRQKVMTGREELIGAVTEALTDIGPRDGKIMVHGEYWNAVSAAPIAKGEPVVIKSVNGLLCRVEKAEPASPPPAGSPS